MPQLTATVKMRHAREGGPLETIERRVERMVKAELNARKAAARTATEVSRQTWNSRLNRRPIAPPRSGRSGTGGRMASLVQWGATRGGDVRLDVRALDDFAPHWIIQEIGTGARATIKRGGKPHNIGRPTRAAMNVANRDRQVRSVKSQVGRKLRVGLVFADSAGGFQRPDAARRRQDQIFPSSRVTGVPQRRASIVIRNEIEGQHFVRKGGHAGFRQYRTDVLAAARQAFKRRA